MNTSEMSKEVKATPCYTKEQIIEAVKRQYIIDFGKLGNDEIERDGYFIAGFVDTAIDNIK